MFIHFYSQKFQIDFLLIKHLFITPPPPKNIRNDSKSNKRTILKNFNYRGSINISGHQFP